MAKEGYRVGIVGGLKLPVNVKVLLENLQRLFEGSDTQFELDLVIREESFPYVPGYNIYDPGFKEPSRALDMPIYLTKGLLSYVRERDPDVLFQITEFATHGTAAVVAGRYGSTPVITRLAGDDFQEYKHSTKINRMKVFTMRNILGQVPLRLADAIVVLGPHVKQQVLSRGRQKNVYEIPQPIDHEQFYPPDSSGVRRIRSLLGVPDDTRVILSVGRLSKRKGMDAVVSAAEFLNRQEYDFHWIILGTGTMKERLATIPNVHPRGQISHNKIDQFYKVADLFVHPSRIDGLPNVLLESTACGVPSIARDIGECSLVATETFERDEELPNLLQREYDEVSLGNRFSDPVLRRKYVDLITKFAGKNS